MNKFDLIIFDCDGTLTDSETSNNQATLDVLDSLGIHYDMDHALQNWVGRTLTNIMLGVQADTGKMLPEDIVMRVIRRTAELQNGMLPVDGAPELVAAAGKKYKICVASNGERSNVLNSLEITGLMPNFTEDSVFTKIQVKNPKPHPDLFLYAAERMNVPPEKCLVIEDSGSGVMAGVAAGMTVFGFTGSSHDPIKHAEYLKAAGAHEIYPRLIHIQNMLGH